MKRLILAALGVLLATPLSRAQSPAPAQPAPPAIPMPQDVLQRISIFLLEGGSHNEGYALNKSVLDAIAIQQGATQAATLTKERDALTKERDDLKAAAKPAAPPAPAVELPGQAGVTPK